ncbi:MAG: hypothetical protein IJA89_07665 [Clostridia bacterium]|nr:hypothetical protein [Clostridia bacterium]
MIVVQSEAWHRRGVMNVVQSEARHRRGVMTVVQSEARGRWNVCVKRKIKAKCQAQLESL